MRKWEPQKEMIATPQAIRFPKREKLNPFIYINKFTESESRTGF